MLILNPSQERPKRIFGKLKNGLYFEGADTGTLNWLFEDFGIESLYEIKESKFYPFGGKYVHSPTVAKIASGVPFEQYGKEIDKNELCNFSAPKGSVVHIDNFGLMKIKNVFPNYPNSTEIQIMINHTESIKALTTDRMMNLETGTWALYPGSSLGLPELGKVRCKGGAKELDVKVGDIITWEKT
jgi:S-adenosylmethionine hydrolase